MVNLLWVVSWAEGVELLLLLLLEQQRERERPQGQELVLEPEVELVQQV